VEQSVLNGQDFLSETEDQAALRSLAREVAERHLAPAAAGWDETETFPMTSWDVIRQAGLFAITIDAEYGGAGLGDREGTIVLEELARADVSSAILLQLIYNGAPRAIEHLGSPAMKQRWLPHAATGEKLFAIGITEAEAGSAVPLMRAHLESIQRMLEQDPGSMSLHVAMAEMQPGMRR